MTNLEPPAASSIVLEWGAKKQSRAMRPRGLDRFDTIFYFPISLSALRQYAFTTVRLGFAAIVIGSLVLGLRP